MLRIGRLYIWTVRPKRWHRLYLVWNPPGYKFVYQHLLAIGPLRFGWLFNSRKNEPEISWAWSPGDGDADTTD